MTPALRFLSNQVWAIHPPVFANLTALLQERAQGIKRGAFDAEMAGDMASAGEPGPQIFGRVAVVPVRGVIARYADQINGACQDAGRSAELLQRDLLAMEANPEIDQIVLRIDSPGGTVAGTAETADVIRNLSKPVIAFVDGMAASAAYWLASQADQIVMGSVTSEVGSIGVITAAVDDSGAQDREGVKINVFRSAPLKAPGAYGERLNPDQVASIQRDLADFHSVFASAVAGGRGLDEKQTEAATTGETWRPTAAIAMGLADSVETFEALMTRLREKKHDKNDEESTGSVAASADHSKQEAFMPFDTKALAALAAQHPNHAGLILAEAGKEGASIEAIQAEIVKAELSAKDAELASVKSELENIKAALSVAQTEAQAKAEALVKLGAHLPKHVDTGDLTSEKPLRRSQMTMEEKAAYQSKHGVAAYQKLPE